LLAIIDGDLEFLRDLAVTLFTNSKAQLLEIDRALVQGDAVLLRDVAHNLKGALASIQSKAAFKAAAQLEETGRAGDLTAARQITEVLKTELERLESALNSLLAAPPLVGG
jgi:HPt (histidine-containing phosphotransfer) domain-containing protein